jgi:hypothetical protein
MGKYPPIFGYYQMEPPGQGNVNAASIFQVSALDNRTHRKGLIPILSQNKNLNTE